MRIKVIREEIGRLSINNLQLIEYEDMYLEDKSKFFIQLGIAGFYLSAEELKQLRALLDHYYNLEYTDKILIKIS